MDKFTRYIVLFMALVLSFSSCQEKKFQVASNTKLEIEWFNAQQSDSIFSKLDSDNQWELLIALAANPYTNPDVVDEWLLQKIERLCAKSPTNPKVIKRLCQELYHANYDQAGFLLANFVLNHPKGKVYKKANGEAAVILAYHYSFLNQKDSLQQYVKVLESVVQLDTTRWFTLAYFSNKAELAELNGQFFEAAINYQKAIANMSPDDTRNSITLPLNLATMYLNMDYVEKAHYYAEQVLSRNAIAAIPITNLNTLGIIASKANDFKQAEALFAKVIQHGIENAQPGLLAQTYANLGNLRRKQKRFEEALNYFAKSDSICGELSIEIGFLINAINRAELYYDQNQFARAAVVLQNKEKAMTQFNIPKVNKEYYLLAYKIQDSLKNSSLANQYYRNYKENKEAYLGDLTRSVIAEWELETEQKKRLEDNTALSLSVEKQTKQKYFIAFLLTLLLFVAAVFYFLNHRRNLLEKEASKQEKIVLAHQLELKSKELLAESLNNLNLQNTKTAILEELQDLIKELPKSQQSLFSGLRRQLKASNGGKFLDEFELRFTGVYEDFYQKLAQLAPDLTPNELKICALIRLAISTKEMAQLTNRSLGTLENTRISIRKKLRLDNQTNLQQFLMGL